jgi:membrane protease YdiL (CAAX protease family)
MCRCSLHVPEFSYTGRNVAAEDQASHLCYMRSSYFLVRAKGLVQVRIRDLGELLVWSMLAYWLATNSEAVIVFALGALYGSIAEAPASVLQNLIYVSPVFPLILGALAVARLKLAGENVWAGTGLSGSTLPGDALLGVFAGVACVGVAITSLQIAARYTDVPAMHTMPQEVHLYFMTIGAVVPGVCEELYFRGMMMRIASRLPAAATIVLTSAAFSIWHVGTPAYLPHTFLLGLIFGILTIVSGRLAPAIVAHTVANAGMGLLFLDGYAIAAR